MQGETIPTQTLALLRLGAGSRRASSHAACRRTAVQLAHHNFLAALADRANAPVRHRVERGTAADRKQSRQRHARTYSLH